MIAEWAFALLAVAVGLPVARLLDREARGTEWVGESFLFGSGVIAAILLLPGLAGAHWSRAWLIAALVVVAIPAWLAARRTPAAPVAASIPATPLASMLYLLIAITLVGYALYATTAPPPEFDFLADWGAKGRVFFEAGSIDWAFLERASYRATHPDYPPLLPLTFDAVALLRNRWDDAAIGLVHVFFACGLVLVVHGAALEALRDRARAALVALALLPLAALPWIGIGEGPFVAFATSALLLLRRGRWWAGACMLGLAAATKNEGLALVAAVALATLLTRNDEGRSRSWRLFALAPAVAIPLPWIVARMLHRLPTDVIAGDLLSRVSAHLRNPTGLAAAFSIASFGKPLLWITLIVGVLVAGRSLFRRERFVLLALLIQCAFYLGAYLASPHDLVWHVRWSWERLVAHLTPALTFVVMVSLLRSPWLAGEEPLPPVERIEAATP